MENNFIQGDCMDYLPQYPDGYFSLAIVDPPYGDGIGQANPNQFGERFNRYQMGGAKRTGGGYAEKYGNKIAAWDIAPDQEYFKELFRVSKYQIIWGGNYFGLPPNRNFIIWRKINIPEKFSMAAVEYAWTNIPGNAKVFEYSSFRDETSGKFHPTEKPIALYKWLLQNYAYPGYRILDTHAGSASSLIACEDMGFRYTAFEIDSEYYKLANERIKEFKKQYRFNI